MYCCSYQTTEIVSKRIIDTAVIYEKKKQKKKNKKKKNIFLDIFTRIDGQL